MIARIWRGVTRESDKDIYFEYLQQTGLKEYASISGNQGVWVLRRVSGERAVYYPEDKRFLLELEPRVQHYEVLSSPAA